MSERPVVGFVGVGTIAEALIDGLCLGGDHRADFLLSPRSADRVAGLAARYPFATVAASNQAVVDGADIVFLSVIPQVAEQVLGELEFHPGQHVVSLIATFNTARLGPLVAPATEISRVIPLPAVARRMGPLSLYPPSAVIGGLLDGLGKVVALDDEAQLDSFLAVTGFMGSYFGLLESIAGWLIGRGVSAEQADAFAASLFHSLGFSAEARVEEGFSRLVTEHSTPGGLNEQAWRELKAAGWGDLAGEALSLLHRRITGQATLADTLPARD